MNGGAAAGIGAGGTGAAGCHWAVTGVAVATAAASAALAPQAAHHLSESPSAAPQAEQDRGIRRPQPTQNAAPAGTG